MALLQDEIVETVSRLPEEQKREVLDFARRIADRPTDRRERIRSLAGSISAEDGEVMLQVIEDGCERIDAGSW